MDGHFGNDPSAFMVRQVNLHLISKMRYDAAIFPAFKGEHSRRGPKPKYAGKIDFHKMDAKYLKETSIADNLRTDTYQGQFYNKEFGFALQYLRQLGAGGRLKKWMNSTQTGNLQKNVG